jgi:2-(1,2-epoxy-1,2-dihydrophenyl)acetyl-CoA isomerase
MDTKRYETILVDLVDGVCTLTMNRPDRLNGMTNLMLFETYEALTRIAADASVRVLVLTGAGRGFCPGADLRVLSEGDPGPELETRWFQVPVLLHEMPAVTAAAVNGACAGAGLGWAAACDLRFASNAARFNTAFLDVSVAGDMGLPWSLPRLIGAARARDLSFFPRKLSAAEALDVGLVTAVFDDETFRDDVATRIARLAAYSPGALRALKQHYVAGERGTFTDLVELESAHHLTLLRDADPAGALAAAAARR